MNNIFVGGSFDEYYLSLIKDLINTGERSSNRTGIDTLYKLGLYMEIDMQKGFPLLTTKKIAWKAAFGEMLGFIRGYTNAKQFRSLGCRVWDQNANENIDWLNNIYRIGTDDLGLIYGYQWRNWNKIGTSLTDISNIDQLNLVYNDLKNNIDNRREIITAWNPGLLHKMALPPCHMTMQFGLRENNTVLDLFLYIRSNDVGLGMPFNVAQYSWLLHLMAKITGHTPGKLLYYAFNYHIYVNHIDALLSQLTRDCRQSPQIEINSIVDSLEFLETTELPIDQWTFIHNYEPHPLIKMLMAV